ncbi:hypothetical protein Q9L58_009023 [Maublancomyces gigas]|uniref:VWFA domain-containing protein n=1 Tax=Discina gigas TaxID=1032678 RepID=A0ABR3G823_9PEZI
MDPYSLATSEMDLTTEECFVNLQKFLNGEKRGLRLFYDDSALQTLAPAAQKMGLALLADGWGKEIAMELSLLTLYDIVILIDDSDSMESEQNGSRIYSLNTVVEGMTSIYDLANPTGIRSIEFVNRKTGLLHVRSKDWRKEFLGVKYDGLSRIGTALKLKILDQYVWRNKMTKPLLVIIITDGDAEGERTGLLEDVLCGCLYRSWSDPGRGTQAVAFQFLRVGDSLLASELLERLDNSAKVGDNVDCCHLDRYHLRSLSDADHKRILLSKILLGAILHDWDEIDEEERVDISSENRRDLDNEDSESEEDLEDD